MRRTFRRGSGYSRSRISRSNYSRFPKKNNRQTYQWSESDLVRTVDYSKRMVVGEEEGLYTPTHAFKDFPVHQKIKENIIKKGYQEPTHVQDESIPYIIEGRDLIGLANTGTGKTAAFLIPLINKVYEDRSQKVLIIAPTRELAEQIVQEFRGFSFGMSMYATLVIGGANMGKQIASIRKNPDFVVGTPGRLKDLINRKVLDLSHFNNVVLDETDRMVDIGFVSEIQLFISMLPVKRQSLFFSATITNKVQEILNSFVNDPVVVNVKKRETRKNIAQDIVRVSGRERKVDMLYRLLSQKEFNKVLVFINTKRSVQKISDELESRGLKIGSIHGDKRQNQRRSVLDKFKRNELDVLLATDVAARGLDINNVSHVINYDLPNSYEDYVHRIGRTGRVDKTGTALTFVTAQ